MCLAQIEALLLIEEIDNIATGAEQNAGTAEQTLDAIHKRIEEFEEKT